MRDKFCDEISKDIDDELMSDYMIRATRVNGDIKNVLWDVYTDKGLAGVFNLGLECMYKFLKNDGGDNY